MNDTVRTGGPQAKREEKKNFVQIFMEGAAQGWQLSVKAMLPALIMAYVMMYLLSASGLTSVLEKVFSPVMGLIGLPGVAIVPMLASIMSKPSGTGAGAALFAQGLLTAAHCTILFPFIIILGGILNQFVRVVLVSGTEAKRQLPIVIIAVIVSFLSIPITILVLKMTGRM